MKRLLLFLFSTPLLTIANDLEEADLVSISNANGGEGVFEIAQDGTLFIPYGSYPHPKGLQIFDAKSGSELVTTFNSLPARLGRIFSPGVPIYFGHPDEPGRPDSDPAAPARGWVQSVTASNDGVTLAVKYNEDGQKAVTGAQFRFYSPRWDLKKIAGGLMPVALRSVGLTNNPRIPVPAIANDDATAPALPTWLVEMLVSAKLLPTAEDAGDETKIKGAIEQALEALRKLSWAQDMEAEALKLRAELATMQSAANDTSTLLAQLEARLTTANDAATASRKAWVGSVLGLLVQAGKITTAQRDTMAPELISLANDDSISTRLDGLRAGSIKLKTESTTGDLGKGKSAVVTAANDELSARALKRTDAIESELSALRKTYPTSAESTLYNMAFNRAGAKHPDLF